MFTQGHSETLLFFLEPSAHNEQSSDERFSLPLFFVPLLAHHPQGLGLGRLLLHRFLDNVNLLI